MMTKETNNTNQTLTESEEGGAIVYIPKHIDIQGPIVMEMNNHITIFTNRHHRLLVVCTGIQ